MEGIRVFPNSWMVYFMEGPWKYQSKMDDEQGYPLDLGNLHMFRWQPPAPLISGEDLPG